ncbi:MAG TPA: hypothetical protein VEJ63_15185, partial [Planctomycetota bacterium]|nr:hypothetical protein [Planctomycetota bacterium]
MASEPDPLPSHTPGTESAGAAARMAAPELAAKELVAQESAGGQTYWGLVWGQFAKNQLALISLYIILLLLLIAAWAPVLSHGRPFIWSQGGKTSYPLFEYLVAPREKMSVDHLFNYFLFLSLSVPLVLIPVWKLNKRAGLTERVRLQRVRYGLLGAALIALLPFLDPHTYERSARPEERVDGVTTVKEFAVFRRWRLDFRDYVEERKELDPSKGDYAIFPPVPFDPESPTSEIRQGPDATHWL